MDGPLTEQIKREQELSPVTRGRKVYRVPALDGGFVNAVRDDLIKDNQTVQCDNMLPRSEAGTLQKRWPISRLGAAALPAGTVRGVYRYYRLENSTEYILVLVDDGTYSEIVLYNATTGYDYIGYRRGEFNWINRATWPLSRAQSTYYGEFLNAEADSTLRREHCGDYDTGSATPYYAWYYWNARPMDLFKLDSWASWYTIERIDGAPGSTYARTRTLKLVNCTEASLKEPYMIRRRFRERFQRMSCTSVRDYCIITLSEGIDNPRSHAFSSVQFYDNSGAAWTDHTTEAGSVGGTPFIMYDNDTNDWMYFGFTEKFEGVAFFFDTPGASTPVTTTVEYSGPAGAWVDVGSSLTLIDGTDDVAGANVVTMGRDGAIVWGKDNLSGWETESVNGSPELYFVRMASSAAAYTTKPTIDHCWAILDGMHSSPNLSCPPLKFDGYSLEVCAPQEPIQRIVASGSGAGSYDGTYSVGYSFVYADGSESKMQPTDSSFAVAGNNIDITTLPLGPVSVSGDAAYTVSRRIYLKKTIGDNRYDWSLVAVVNDNTTTSYTLTGADGDEDQNITPYRLTTDSWWPPLSVGFWAYDVETHNNRIFAYVNDGTLGHRLAFTNAKDGLGTVQEWNRTTNYLGTNLFAGSKITGLHSLLKRLFIFQEHNIHTLNTPFMGAETWLLSTPVKTVGCIAPKTITHTPYGIAFLARDLKVYLYNPNQGPPRSISDAWKAENLDPSGIQEWNTAYNDQCVGAYFPLYDQYWLWYTNTGPDVNYTVLAYDFRRRAWFRLVGASGLGESFGATDALVQRDGTLIWGSSAENWLHKYDVGNTVFTDPDGDVMFYVRTKRYYMGAMDVCKDFERMRIWMTRDGVSEEMKVFAYIDSQDGGTHIDVILGTEPFSFVDLPFAPVTRGHGVQIELGQMIADDHPDVLIGGLAISYFPDEEMVEGTSA